MACGFAATRSGDSTDRAAVTEPLAGVAARPQAVRTAGGCPDSPVHVGASLPTDPAEPLLTVADIYSVWGGPENTVEIAWFYFAGDGKTIFLQYNYASIAAYGTRALGIRLDSVAAPGGFGALVRWNHQPVARHYRVMKCAAPGTSS
jgi:hypothetical protein